MLNVEAVTLGQNCKALIQRRVPQNLADTRQNHAVKGSTSYGPETPLNQGLL